MRPIVSNGDTLRLGVFILIFLIVATWEVVARRRDLKHPRSSRWYGNIGLGSLNPLVLRFCFPILVVGIAVQAQQHGWGLFNLIEIPQTMEFLLCLLLLDFAIYLQHIAFHRLSWLWRLHKVHHSDPDFDLSTALRFHPLEIVLSMFIKMIVAGLLGVPPLAVLIFEIVLNLTAMFNHGNIKIPIGVDRVLRKLLVTPDMHRVHHSTIPTETNSNYGFNLSCWDYLFHTYVAQPENGHDDMTVGLDEYKGSDKLRLLELLTLPFK
jgi:sterol desaturase/sphingolipid hydroxylase (fatty acid hydroxylase superfamily)